MADKCKTKIIATLGNPTLKDSSTGTYKGGIQSPDLTDLDPLDYNSLIKLLVDSHWPNEQHGIGANVIRLNLAHIGGDDTPERQAELVTEKFRAVKKALIEIMGQTKQRLSIIADIPGPKIRIKADDGDWYAPRKKLTIALGEQSESFSKEEDDIPDDSTVLVNIGTQSFSSASPEAASDILRDLRILTDDNKCEKPLAYIGDNDCTLIVDSVDEEKLEIYCTVHDIRREDRLLGTHKGFTVRGVPKPIQAFTNEDKIKLGALLKEDLRDCKKDGGDNRVLAFIGISFCQSRDDVKNVMYHAAKIMRRSEAFKDESWETILAQMPSLIAKIETVDGAKNIDQILDLADGAMIARGDLALEAPMTDLPTIAKNVMNACHMRGKPVIVATQMLESMKTSIECTRPEATDVFNAVVDGADTLMLSGETSSGRYPAHAIRKMRKLATSAERYVEGEGDSAERRHRQKYAKQLAKFNERTSNNKGHYTDIFTRDFHPRFTNEIIRLRHEEMYDEADKLESELAFLEKVFQLKEGRLANQPSTDKITHAACLMAADDTVIGIIAPTTSGRTTRMLARFRPKQWIYAQPHNEFIAKKLAIVRGVQAGDILTKDHGAQEVQALMTESACMVEAELELDFEGHAVIFTCGTPLRKVGTTNLVQRWDKNTFDALCAEAK